MKWLILILFVYLWFMFPLLRFIILHPISVITIGISDIYKYFKYKRYNECKEFGRIRLNSAKSSQVFGCGKTLSLVRQAVHIYKRYDGLQVWDPDVKEFVTQHIHIISNVKLFDVPYIQWTGENQFIDIDKFGFGSMDITIYLLDEAGTVFNSRNFRDNISMEFLTRMLQSRKNKMALYMTSQRFIFTDKILRQTCSTVTTCKKLWRFIELCDYDAYEVENVVNLSMLRPISVKFWFAKDKDYHSYDSYQLIEQLKKDNEEGNLLSTPEILDTYGSRDGSLSDSTHLKHKFKDRVSNYP